VSISSQFILLYLGNSHIVSDFLGCFWYRKRHIYWSIRQ